jgi:hypothetical protein
MSADTRAGTAAKRIADLGYNIDFADRIVAIVLDELGQPDAHMLAAGLEELNLAMGPKPDPKHGDAYRRELARVIWAAMLDRVR